MRATPISRHSSQWSQQMASSADQTLATLHDLSRRLRRAQRQLVVLTSRAAELKGRYQRARQTGHMACRYNLRVQLAVCEGVANMYYEYASLKCDQIQGLLATVKGPQQ